MSDEILKVILVETGEFSAGFEAVSVLWVSQEVHGHVFDDGHVFGSEAGAEPGEIVVKDDVEHPVEAIFHVPVCAHGAGEIFGAEPG